jgi:hypothetical protein
VLRKQRCRPESPESRTIYGLWSYGIQILGQWKTAAKVFWTYENLPSRECTRERLSEMRRWCSYFYIRWSTFLRKTKQELF